MRGILSLWAIALIFLAGCNGEIRDFDNTQYENATIVGTIGNSKEKINIKTSTGVNVTVFSPSIDSVSLAFQDENTQKEIYHTHFIQSVEARQPRDKNLIFIKISGTYMSRLNEAEKEVKIIVYNLSTRKLIGWTKTK